QMRDTVRQVQVMQQDVKDEMRELDKQVVGYAVHHLIDELTEKYSEIQGVIDYLEACRKDILENVENFKKAKQMEQAQQQMPIPLPQQSSGPTFDKYRVNLIVDHCDTEGAPVVVESNPT
ncbi:MAG: AAA family ATPase, partial [Aliifodinibius sp.]|nr:AAA family ATPase [candidate division Zixibacteria bacterium]NIT55574.1 AAA family ATPase [Fodinibius sp.]NIW43823.1 AAA family ATPase [Gammaproteobacteria bacterium]NIU13066.1 AAA family ATPase [candidate division Zixibacteria bacterium]NIV05128.1 AAA family ATPase [candidate division Zixibacteria bacterium]